MQSGKWNRIEGGATLIETLVALAILAFITIAVLGLYSTGHTAARLAQGLDQASLLAQRRLEQVKATAACNERPPTLLRQQVDPLNFPGYEWEVKSEERAPGLHHVSVTVYWMHLGRERQVELVTYIRTRSAVP